MLTDSKGQRHDLSTAQNPRLEIVRPGPVTVGLRYTAAVPIDTGYAVPVEILIEMPSSKSWVKLAATVRDPSRRVRDIAIETPLAFGAMPILWDFGTDSGTYGVFRNPGDSVLLTQTRNASGASWKIETVAQGQPRRPYETSAGTRVKSHPAGGICRTPRRRLRSRSTDSAATKAPTPSRSTAKARPRSAMCRRIRSASII